MNPEFHLCYVNEPWAWFTTCSLDQQWGDDWNDSPYEHNAGPPYLWRPERNVESYEILRVAWTGPFMTPDYEHFNSPYTVQQINQGHIAWLRPCYSEKNLPPIPAGTTFVDFCSIMQKAGGKVYTALGTNNEDTLRWLESIKSQKS